MVSDPTYGNVSRTMRPCGACADLVESCQHWHPKATHTPGRRYSRREIAAATATATKREQAELLRQLGVETADRRQRQVDLLAEWAAGATPGGRGGHPRKDV